MTVIFVYIVSVFGRCVDGELDVLCTGHDLECLIGVACCAVKDGHGVLAPVGDVLAGLGGQQSQEGQLHGVVDVGELQRKTKTKMEVIIDV